MIALTLALIVGASMAAVVLAVARAPLGYQDSTGFHFGNEPGRRLSNTDSFMAPVILSNHDREIDRG